MSSRGAKATRYALPNGYKAVAISADSAAAPLRICAVCRGEAEPPAGHLVVLREALAARVLLGCLCDAGGNVHQWLELWVQDLAGLSATTAVCREALSNASLDARWARQAEAMGALDAGLIRTGWETAHPLPTFLDLATGRPVHPRDADSGEAWVLCEDDAALAACGLPPYGTSVFRYLHLPALQAKSPFVPVVPDAPTCDRCRPLSTVTGDADWVPLNPGGGLLLVRGYGAMGYEAFVDLLSGARDVGLLHGRSPLELDAAGAAAAGREAPDAAGRLFLGSHGRWGRLVETFHLKCQLLADTFAAVRSAAEGLARPILSLTADSFQVELAPPGRGLPALWTAKAVLADAGDAVELPIGDSEAKCYMRAGAAGASVYRPVSATAVVRGRSVVRIRQVLDDTDEGVVLEGTFATQERLDIAGNDLVWLRLNLGAGRIDLYARLVRAEALAAGEWRFRTVPLPLAPEAVAALKAAEGVPMPETPFEVVPQTTTPCDLYALGVLGVRTLLVDVDTSLPIALDEMLSLVRQVADEHDDRVDLGRRIRTLMENDPRWPASVGPCRLTHEPMAPAEAFDAIPAALWCDALAMLVRLFPGLGPDSTCADYGDAPVGGLHRVFDRAIEDLDGLGRRTRSLIVVDWHFNRQVHAVLRRHWVALAGAEPPRP